MGFIAPVISVSVWCKVAKAYTLPVVVSTIIIDVLSISYIAILSNKHVN